MPVFHYRKQALFYLQQKILQSRIFSQKKDGEKMKRNSKYFMALFLSLAMTVTPAASAFAQSQNAESDSSLDATTEVIDNSTTLPDGTYTPDTFSWSGGSGRITISCDEITVKDGKAYATIVFSSEYYGYVKADGETYYGDSGDGISTFTIPVVLNQNNTVIGMTTRMSQAHEITYTIYAALEEDGADSKENSESSTDTSSSNNLIATGNETLDETAPKITGLESNGEAPVSQGDYFRLYSYENGILLLEIDMETDTDSSADTDSSENTTLYTANVVKYLILPEAAEIPAGLDKEAVLIQKPVASIYNTSDSAKETLDGLGFSDLITASGTYKDTDYKALVKNQCQLAILSSEILQVENEDVLQDAAEKYSTLGIPFIVDRSADEQSDASKEMWATVYASILEPADMAD